MGRQASIGTALAVAVAMLATGEIGDNAVAFVHNPVAVQYHQPGSGIRSSLVLRPRPTARALGRARCLSQVDRRRIVKMDASDDLEQLKSILGMPETIDIAPVFNASSHRDTSVEINGASPLLPPPHDVPGAANSILSTFGMLGGTRPVENLPEYSVEPTKGGDPEGNDDGVAPAARGPVHHASSVAKEIAQKIAKGGSESPAAEAAPSWSWGVSSDDPVFRAAALKSVTSHVVSKEKQQAATAKARTGPARIDATRVPNLWLAVAHSSDLKAGEVKKVEVDGIPLSLWRSATGEVSAISDVCIHRGASLSRGWVSVDRLVCPYHGFEFETDGCLAHMPGAGPPTGSSEAQEAKGGVAGRAAESPRKTGGGRGAKRAPTYPVKEVGGWIYIFPDETRPGSVEMHTQPLVIPEAESPAFRAVSGSMDMTGGVSLCVENMLDMLHISFVHTFGNANDPTPFEVSYAEGFDDPGTEALPTSQVTFRYRSGSKSFSKAVGAPEVVVKNEFHLPYRAVIRVFFGEHSLKTIEATAVPVADGKTTLHWKLYRNFAITHPLDEGPINKAGDALFRKMMEVTLTEDKEIIENIYPEYQKGFMNARYDRQMLQYRKAINRFQEISEQRANSQMESSLQMELLNRIASSQRGLTTSSSDRSAILNLIERLEKANSNGSGADDASTKGEFEDDLEGKWHLEYISNVGNGEQEADGWDFAESTELNKSKRVAALQSAGGESLLFDWNEKGRPIWADTEESIQIIDTKAQTLTNRAVYKGWSGFTTVVQLDAYIEPLKDQANRLMVGFRKAIVDVGGIKVTFPHLQRFSPTGWLETTYVNQGIRIARGNKGSIFVLTRQPVASSVLFKDERERSP